MAPLTQTALTVVTLAVMLLGLAGLILVIFPGLNIIWLAALVYGLITGFDWVSGVLFAFITLIMLVGNLADNVLMSTEARQTGASWLSIGVALVAGLLGSLFFPPFGGLIAALLGLFIIEYIRIRNWRQAANSMRGMALGCGWVVVVRIFFGLVMIFIWGLWAFVL